MKRFKIGVFEEVGGYISIEAENEENARETVKTKLNDEGVDGFKDFDITHRDTSIVDFEEVE